MPTFSETFAVGLKQKLRATSTATARDFLFEQGYMSSGFKMPEYYSANNFDQMNLAPITNWWMVPMTRALDFLTPKGPSAWRRFSFIHPFIYWHIVDQLTEQNNWNLLVTHLTQETLVSSYTVPDFDLGSHSTLAARDTGRWILMSERDILKDADGYNFVGTADIQNFYPSIYTHSISWALHTKEVARADKNDRNLLGNRLDRLLQYARDGKTNGIPVGSIVSDVIAEVILTSVDASLTATLRRKGLDSQVRISRFRDDYRILGKTADAVSEVRKILNRTLHDEFDLTLNPAKSHTFNDVIDAAYRPWTVQLKKNPLLLRILNEDLPSVIEFNFLRDALIETYELQKMYPQDRVTNKILGEITQKIDATRPFFYIEIEDVLVIVSILRKLILAREEVTPEAVAIVESMLVNCAEPEIEFIVDELLAMVSGAMDNEYQVIWIYRLCHAILQKKCPKIIQMFPDNVLLQLMDEESPARSFAQYLIFHPELPSGTPISTADESEMEKIRFVNVTEIRTTLGQGIDISKLALVRY